MMGDASDNIRDFREVGKETATKLVAAYGTARSRIPCAHGWRRSSRPRQCFLEHYDLAVLSKKLATVFDSPIDFVLEDARFRSVHAGSLCPVQKAGV